MANDNRPIGIAAIAGYALALVPPTLTAFFIATYTLDLPIADSWSMAHSLKHMEQGTLTFSDLWMQHNEHRLPIPRVLLLFLARLSNWNQMWEVYASFGLATATLATYGFGLRRLCSADRCAWLPWIVPLASLLIFSLAQHENWLMGWQLQIFLNVFAVVLAAFLLLSGKHERLRFAGAILAAIVATYSFANGMLVFVSALPAVWLGSSASVRERWMRTAIWCSAAGATIVPYFVDYQWPADGEANATPLDSLNLLLFVLAFLGNPIATWDFTAAAVTGSIGVTVFLLLVGFALRARGNARIVPVLTLGIYAIGSAALTAYGRHAWGREYALESRYVTIANVFWLAVIAVVILVVRPPRAWSGRSAAVLAGCSSAALLVASGVHGFKEGSLQYRQQIPARDNLVFGLGLDFLLEDLHPRPFVIRSSIDFMRENNLAAFAQQLDYDPDHAPNYVGRGNGYFVEGKLTEAIQLYHAATEIAPAYAEAHARLGAAYHDYGRFPDAVAALERALELDDSNAAVRANLGRAYRRLGRLDEAEQTLRAALAEQPYSATTHNSLGLVLMDRGRSAEADSLLQRAIELDPTLVEARVNYANLLIQGGDAAGAIAPLRRALDMDTKNAEGWASLGTAYLLSGDTREAIGAFESSLAIRPEDAMTRTNLAAAYLTLGDRPSAVQEAERALESDPSYSKARQVLAFAGASPQNEAAKDSPPNAGN